MVLEWDDFGYASDGWLSLGGELRFFSSDEIGVHKLFSRLDTNTRSPVLTWHDNKTYLDHADLSGISMQAWGGETFIVWRREV